jgi:outer membrane autotransporter protein
MDGGLIQLDNATIIGGNAGVFLTGSTAIFNGSKVTVTGNRIAIRMESGAELNLQDSLLQNAVSGTVAGEGVLDMRYTDTRATLTDTTILATGQNGIYAYKTGAITGTNLTIIQTGVGSALSLNPSSSTIVTLVDSNLTAEGSIISLWGDGAASPTINIEGGSLTSTGTTGYIFTIGGAGDTTKGVTINVSDGTVLTNADGRGLLINNTGSAAVVLNLDDVDATEAGGITSATNNGSTDVIVSGGSGIHGDVTNSGSGSLSVTLDDSSLTGDITNKGDGSTTVTGSNDSTITGDITNSSSGTMKVDLDDSTLTGDVIANGDGTVIITGSNGSTIIGDVTANDNSTVEVTVSGSDSSFVGDITKNDDAAVTITINDGATGTGGFDGGNLNVGDGSTWNFDKDSHVNDALNDGTLNIGDHEVKFDNLVNNGKLIINVDTDSGGKGSVDVTGTAGGNGEVVINTSGNGTGNKDEILKDIVKGNGTEGWTWAEVEWGLEEDDVIVEPDGSIYLQSNGKLSTVGNIATGLVAAQKGAWFAQQNSLLKRLGDLRLGEAFTVSANADDKNAVLTADKLIEKIWLRSYGQQLNYGASVTGHAFRQYVYGVDLGTDHKWTLDANNALYTGVFAGYGQADTDHRHHGSESESSSYYGGLYVSWLNEAGWYADLTIKAQYADNDLSGWSNGVDYFSASYGNWGIGGSLELGKRFTFANAWFIEPQLQANYLHLLADDYTIQGNRLDVNVSELDACQFRAGLQFGRAIKLANGGVLQPYLKVSGVELVSRGGKISAAGNNIRPNLDGARAELGGGLIWQLDANNQLHLDYEASFGDKYDKPWGLTAGYRYQF